MGQLKTVLIIIIIGVFISSFGFCQTKETYSLTVSVNNLQNSKGVIQFTLYNKEGSIPDEHFENYYKQLKATINENSSEITFHNLSKGNYAVNILHDENEDGEIDKGFILPIEGIGFSNLETISPLNRPNFKKTKFELNTNKTILVKMIYL